MLPPSTVMLCVYYDFLLYSFMDSRGEIVDDVNVFTRLARTFHFDTAMDLYVNDRIAIIALAESENENAVWFANEHLLAALLTKNPTSFYGIHIKALHLSVAIRLFILVESDTY